jgi:hypothetical protein
MDIAHGPPHRDILAPCLRLEGLRIVAVGAA